MSIYPSIGSQDFYINSEGQVIEPRYSLLTNKYSKSNTFLDSLITDHSRFKSFTQNTRLR